MHINACLRTGLFTLPIETGGSDTNQLVTLYLSRTASGTVALLWSASYLQAYTRPLHLLLRSWQYGGHRRDPLGGLDRPNTTKSDILPFEPPFITTHLLFHSLLA